jgi:hypothetical protein
VVTTSISAVAPTFNVSFTGNPPFDDHGTRALQAKPMVQCIEAVGMTHRAAASQAEPCSATRPAGHPWQAQGKANLSYGRAECNPGQQMQLRLPSGALR